MDKKYSKKKEKLQSIIFIRACCCIGIIIFHYSCSSNGKVKILYTTANASFGFMFVTSFFIISGVVLYYNYPKILSFKSYYYKRWKSILVPYYICFTYFFLKNIFKFHKFFYKDDWAKIFLTLIGLDGYLSYKIKSYYLVGEWFLGALIILYIIYPFLLCLMKNNIIINNIIISFFYYLMYKRKYFAIHVTRNIITCAFSFYFGMEIIRYKKFYLRNKIPSIISVFLLIFLYSIKIKINFYILIHQIQGFSLFLVLYQIGYYVMKTKLNIIFFKIANISFSIYLLHRQIIFAVLSCYNPKYWYIHIILFSVTILLTIICSNIHLMIVNSVFNSYIFKKIDSLFI